MQGGGGECFVRGEKSNSLMGGSVNATNPSLVKAMVHPRSYSLVRHPSVSPGEKQAELTIWVITASLLFGKSDLPSVWEECLQ